MSRLERAFPEPSSVSPITEPEPRRGLAGVHELVARRYGETLTLADMAQAAGMPTNTLTRRFQDVYGTSPMRWLWAFRTLLAAELIAASPAWPLGDVAIHCGFGSSAHFSRRFRTLLKDSPSRHRARARLAAATTVGAAPMTADKRPLVNLVLAQLANPRRSSADDQVKLQ